MRGQDESPHRAVAELARRQHGVVDRSELVALGLSTTTLERWATEGRLHRLYRGVYAVGHTVLTVHGRWLAAVKACGPGAVLSHTSAAALWDLIRSSSPIIHVTTPNRGSPRGLRVHRVRRLHPDDVALIDEVPVTSVARTLLDLADVLPPRRLIRAIEQAERLQIFDLSAINELVGRSSGRRVRVPEQRDRGGHWRARQLRLGARPPRLLRRPRHPTAGVERPRRGLRGGRSMAGEEDRRRARQLRLHRSRRAFEQDREKYADLQLAGYLVLPITRLDTAAARRITAAMEARRCAGAEAVTRRRR